MNFLISCLNYNFNRCAIGETGTTLNITIMKSYKYKIGVDYTGGRITNSVAYFVLCAVMLIASMVAMGYLFMNL